MSTRVYLSQHTCQTTQEEDALVCIRIQRSRATVKDLHRRLQHAYQHEALSHITENRKVGTRKRLIFQHPILAIIAHPPHVMLSMRGVVRNSPSSAGSFPGAGGLCAR